jgi:hypothetical protein
MLAETTKICSAPDLSWFRKAIDGSRKGFPHHQETSRIQPGVQNSDICFMLAVQRARFPTIVGMQPKE